MNKWPRFALNALGLTISLTGSAFAQLAAVDPGPYTFATGKFPMWYQDNNQLSMELCQSRAASSRVPVSTPPAYMCTLLPEPGVFDDTLPMVFPDNWPPEAFWFLAETNIPNNGAGFGVDAYVAGIEAAFASGNPVDGDQQSFARIRIRVNVPVAGTYTITHPYGVETVNVTTPGRRAINITKDIGIGAPGNFSGALNGAIGPFLRSINGPYTEVNPDTGGIETFVGDPNLTEAVTGSPFNTNFLRIDGPSGAGSIQTNLFTVAGKVLDNRQQTHVAVDRATYRRTSAGVRAEVFAEADSSSTLCFRETLALLPGPPPTPCQTSLLGDNNGLFFGQRLGTGTLPSVVVVTATNPAGTTRPTAVSAKLTDVVKIQTARYSWADHSLLIEATSTDEVAVPDMVAQGYGRLSKSGTLQKITVADLTQPPATVTVKSAAGGSDTEPVVVVGTAPDTGENQAPLAVADTGSTSFGVPITLSLLTNDSDPDNNVPLTITALTQPAAGQGTVALSGTTSVVYTPPAVVNTPLTTTFTYKAQDSKGLASANPATVTISVAPNRPPTAVADSVATLGVAIPINVLANDTDPEGNTPLGVASLTQPPAGRGTVSTDGTVITYTPPATVTTAFTTTFTYIARDSFGAQSTPATVTVQVSPRPAAETFTITTSTVQARSGGRFNWDFAGTSSVTTGNTITVQVTTPTGLVTLGSTTVPVTGRWRLTLNNTLVVPSANPTATIRSSQGTVRTVSVTTL
ncbi:MULTISPECIES: Ig-like domain-containing protein [Pseudomonas]|uniref:Ig-like domain-containing protein n=1 Tax=Pseudomonas TaxID=286 RepID=UPI000A1DD1AD|nr:MULTISPECIES: Ig-like domain-containing protein [Pseudomonas]MCX4218897.1 Ig-like domain-containing protein [Pseudomonas sp. MCal1]UIN53163.1 Ig-like domain-containing protein [Pseudomonas kribbensis]